MCISRFMIELVLKKFQKESHFIFSILQMGEVKKQQIYTSIPLGWITVKKLTFFEIKNTTGS